MSEALTMVVVAVISLLILGLSVFATLKVSKDRSIPGWLRIVLILVFFGWPVISPAIYLFIRYRDQKKEEKRISFR